MRLPKPFIRLPILVDADALAAEVAAIDARSWRLHPEGAAGNTALPLIAVGGDPSNDSTIGPMRPTPNLESLPRIERVLAGLDTVVGRTRLMRIEEEGELNLHVDTNYYWWGHVRVHIPVVSSPEVVFECDGVREHMAPGEVWVFDTWKLHRVLNPARIPRVHLVVDTVGSASLWDRIERPDQAVVRIDDPMTEAALVLETVNHPTVMSPWEVDAILGEVLDDLGSASPGLADRLRAALVPWRHSWRARWAEHGDQGSGSAAFAALRAECDQLVERIAGDARMPNQVLVTETILQLVLRPALLDRERARAVVPATAELPPVTIDRPVFVVSSPRAGSTLFFETLARAPDLFTVGGESHHVIEVIPALQPSAHGWESNRLDERDATPDAVAALHQSFIGELRDHEGRVPVGGAVRMLEKTPKNSLRVPFLAAAFPDAYFVYLYRDPRETISSMLDAWKSGRFVTYPGLDGWDGPPWSLLLVPGWRELSGASLAEIVTTQWATATSLLLDDLEAIDPQRWCVASYDQLVADPRGEMERVAAFVELPFGIEVSGELPLSRHTLDSPHPEKWRRNADELEPHWERVREVATRAHDVFAAPPRVKPVRPATTAPRTAASGAPAAIAAAPAAVDPDPDGPPFRSVHTSNLPEMLRSLNCSLAVSTYQSGRVILVRADGPTINTHFCGFDVPMGVAASGPFLAVGTKTQVHVFQNQPAVIARLEDPERHDACFVPRRSHSTGDVKIHDLAFAGDDLWLVNTRFSCLATLDDVNSFVPRWRPPFITALAPEDRCHLNGMAVVDDEPRFVTALGTTDEEGGWRENKATGGVVLDVPTGEVVAAGLCMPHSPRWYANRLWVLESGTGSLGVVDVEAGSVQEVAQVPGFARGLSFAGPYAFIGLSQVREHVFEGIPLTAEGVERTCGVWVVDIRTGAIAAFLKFEGVVQEIFEVVALQGMRYPEIIEPGAELLETTFVLPDTALVDVPEARRS